MPRIYTSLVAVAAIAVAGTVSAHDFWLQPSSFSPEAGEIVDVAPMVGHPEDQSLWPLTAHRLIALRSYGPDGVTDRQSALSSWQPLTPLEMSFDIPGYHLVTMETTSAFSTLEAEKFNDYVKEEGISPIQIHRISNAMTGLPGTEIYSRRGKVLIEVGETEGASTDHVTKPVGLTLEIVPQSIPSDASEISAKIYYRGEAMRGVSVALVSLSDTRGDLDRQLSGEDGGVIFEKPEPGAYMLHAVWSDPLESDEADYDTIFSSFSFAID